MTQNRNFRAAVFDLDGTLLDSMGVWAEVDRLFLSRRGLPMTKEYCEAIAPIGFPAAAAYTRKLFSLPESEEAIMAEWHETAVEAYAHHVDCKPGVRAYLAALEKKGIRIAAATASMPVYYLPALERCGIRRFFSSVTELAEVSRGKGFPDIYLRAAEKLGLPPAQCVVFEDLPAGLSGARAGGFYTVGVYDVHNDAEDAVRETADRYIRDFSELLAEDVF